MTYYLLMGVRTRTSMVKIKDDKAVTYVNSETGLGRLRIVKDVDRLIYICDTDMEEGHRSHSIEYTIYLQIYLQIPIDLLDLAVKCWLHFRVLSNSSVLKSTRSLLNSRPELYVPLQFYITDEPITLYTWLFVVPSSKQVVDREGSTTILQSLKGVRRTSPVTWWLNGYFR